MSKTHTPVDAVDARLLLALSADANASTQALAAAAGISRNTAADRLARLERSDVLRSAEHRIDPSSLGYPLTAFVTARVTQGKLAGLSDALAQIPEVLQVHGVSGAVDLFIHIVGVDAEDLYRIAGQILATDGIERTSTALVMRRLVDYRVGPLLESRT